jgi:hypothetical protein
VLFDACGRRRVRGDPFVNEHEGFEKSSKLSSVSLSLSPNTASHTHRKRREGATHVHDTPEEPPFDPGPTRHLVSIVNLAITSSRTSENSEGTRYSDTLIPVSGVIRAIIVVEH